MITLLTILVGIIACVLCLWAVLSIGVQICWTMMPILVVITLIVFIKKETKKGD